MLRTYTNYNAERPHRSLALLPPGGNDTCKEAVADVVERRDLLGGLIHEMPSRGVNRVLKPLRERMLVGVKRSRGLRIDVAFGDEVVEAFAMQPAVL